jgi:flagellar hook protein FlgE
MGISFGNFLYGLSDAQQIINRSSYNIANINTENYIPVDSLTGEIPNNNYSADSISFFASGVDIAKEQVSQIIGSASYKANLKGIETVDELAGEIIDILG